AVIEHLAPQGAGSPLHVHHNEDEWFYVTEGELTFWVGGQLTDAPAGSFVYGPRGIPHTFTVTSPEARFLLVTEPAGFEGFMRALAEPAQSLTLPPPPNPPPPPPRKLAPATPRGHATPRPPPPATSPPPDPERMMAIATEYGIEILGPPGIPT